MDEPSHPLVSLFSAFFFVLIWILAWIRTAVAFATITVPRLIYAILSYSLTLNLDFKSLVIIFFLCGIGFSLFVRYGYLNNYSTLKEVPLGKPSATELHPDVQGADPPQPFHNYLDEFLQAVRVFGFLEKPVFHELARHLQTRRLIAGDSLSLDQDKSFYCVVDGMVQVYTQTGMTSDTNGQWDDEETNGYQLLNEVGSGGTLSSLFTILSLFTEDIKIEWPESSSDTSHIQSQSRPTGPSETGATSRPRANSEISQLNLSGGEHEPLLNGTHFRSPSVSSGSTSTVQGQGPNISVGPPSPISPASPTNSRLSMSPEAQSWSQTSRKTSQPAHNTHAPPFMQHGTVARATVDTTLAVIPAEAFRRLTKKFPKSSAHIIQVILTRFSRVTFNTAHKYLGLTTELLRTEKAINELAGHPLPASFYESGGIERLRQRFLPEPTGVDTYDSSDSEMDYFSAEHGDIWTGAVPTQSPISDPTLTAVTEVSPSNVFRSSAANRAVNAGDLHTMTGTTDTYRPFRRTWSILNTPKPSQEDVRHRVSAPLKNGARLSSGDFDLREEVMSCIAKCIGLIQPPLNGVVDSADASPFVHSVDGRETPMFNSSFSSLSFLETADDASSTTGGSSMNSSHFLSAVDNEVEILYFAAGSTLVRAGERNAGIFYVIDGFLDVSIPAEDIPELPPKDPATTPRRSNVKLPDTKKQHEKSRSDSKSSPSVPFPGKRRPSDAQSHKPAKLSKHLFTVKPGGIAGYLASLSGIASYVDIKAKTDVYVGFLPFHSLERLLEKRPIVLLTLAKRLISLLSPLVLHIDSSLDWMQVNAGQVLWRPGDSSDSFYIVINGRLRALSETPNGGVEIVAEYGQGDTVGELDVITNAPRRTTLHAIRDTELARMPLTLFNAISIRHPQTTVQLLRMIASRVRNEVGSSAQIPRGISDLGRNNFNLKTVAIIPASRHVPVSAFAKKLKSALEGIGAPTSYLNQASVMNHLGRHAFTRMGKLKVAGWLADQEQRYRIVLYVADSTVSAPWTQTCILQADCIMVVGMGDDPSIGEYERLLLSTKTTARKELVLLHPDRSVIPGSTREWLKNRPWIHAHFHVELPGVVVPKPAPILDDPAAVIAFKNLKNKVQTGIEKYRRLRSPPQPRRQTQVSDFARLARRLCGKSIGVVLGGGGARGLSHLGVLQALEEEGIPIDQIGGTSIGAFISGLYAREVDLISSAGRAKQFSGRMSSVWRILSDVTYPIVAYTTGHEFNRSIYKAFYDLHIEDMWLPYFTVSTNITKSTLSVHNTGYAWRYIRASMTLVGLLPPLCDNGDMLVDGGYIDNLPVSTMVSMGANTVFAVDVATVDDTSPRNFGDSVSGWWLFLNRWNPFSATRNIPPITEIQSRLAYVSSVKTLEDAKQTSGCLYMQMPVQSFGTLQFAKFEEIQAIGYNAGKQMLETFRLEGRLPSGFEEGHELTETTRRKSKGRSLRRNSI